MTPEPNIFTVEQNPVPQNWREAAVNPRLWGEGTYTCKVTTRDGREIYGYIESSLGLLEIPILFDKQIPDKAMHLYSELNQAHIVFDQARKDMFQINSRSLDKTTYESVLQGLGISYEGVETKTGGIACSFVDDHSHSGVETRVFVKYESKDILSKLKVHDVAQGLEEGLGWKIEPISSKDLSEVK